jgi:molybdate transport system substrate-binding protein
MTKLMRAGFSTLLLLAATASAAAEPIRVFAAASLTNALETITAGYEQATGTKVLTSLAASGALAKQIESGAPADVFIGADAKWMDYLVKKDLVVAASRRDLLGNTLTLVAPKGKAFEAELKAGFDLPAAFAGKLCTGDPESVPVGIYAKEALTKLGWWEKLAPRIAGAEDVRSALGFVERGECGAGIVYATDAKSSGKVDVVAAFPAASHEPIVYPVALVKGRPAGAATDFVKYLSGPQAKAVFEKLGFVVLP